MKTYKEKKKKKKLIITCNAKQHQAQSEIIYTKHEDVKIKNLVICLEV
jgi:hypothetical protein